MELDSLMIFLQNNPIFGGVDDQIFRAHAALAEMDIKNVNSASMLRPQDMFT